MSPSPTSISAPSHLPAPLNLEQVLEQTLAHLAQVVAFRCACIALLREGQLHVAAEQGLGHPVSSAGRVLPTHHPAIRRVLEGAEPVVLSGSEARRSAPKWSGLSELEAWLGVPLMSRGRAFGILILECDRADAFGQNAVTLAQAFAGQAAIGILSARWMLEMQRSMRRSQLHQARLQEALDGLPDGLLVLDLEQRILLSNIAARGYLRRLSEVTGEQLPEKLGNKPLDLLLDTSSASGRWLRLQSADGREEFEATARRLVQADGPDQWLLVLRDITQSLRLEQYLQTQDRLTTVGRLASGIVHDFNNTMAVVTLYAQLVLRTAKLSQKDRERLETVHEQAREASRLIQQITAFSHKSTVERVSMDLAQLLKEATADLKNGLPRNIRLELQIDEGPFPMRGNTDGLQQMVRDLADHAREGMPAGGPLHIALSSQSVRASEPLPLPDMHIGDWYRLSITDGGHGLGPERLSHIFEPYYGRKSQGGDGRRSLAQVYSIVKQHDGFIDARSLPGEGTSFTIYLPAHIRPAPEATRPAAAEPVMGHGQRILVVEDDTQTREALAEIIELLNYRVVTAANGEEALALFDSSGSEIDLVISDMEMPTMGGAQLYRAFRNRRKQVKMILLSGYPLDSDGRDMLSQGIVAYIQKPLRVHEIAAAIQDALPA
jgi:two-component system, cell cycle sensor histidine kinase and response regulator CckA